MGQFGAPGADNPQYPNTHLLTPFNPNPILIYTNTL